MTTIPSLDSENEIPLRHEFICTGFIVQIAAWARFLCLSFLFLQLLTIAFNLIFPFAIDPPLFFNQLLFFLLACAAFEVFAIPIEAIKDHSIIDLQKGMVVKIYHRYFYTKIEVLAPFDKILAIGVSSRPEPMWKGVFSKSLRRYAILMLAENSVCQRITDYNLSLDEANKLVKSLHESYLRNADVIYGSRNVELLLDPKVEGTFVTAPGKRSAMSIIDAAILPTIQAATGAAMVAVLIAITATIGDFLSDRLFNTSLKIRNQPVFQLLLLSGVPDPEIPELEPPAGPPPALPSSLQETVHADPPLPETSDYAAVATSPEVVPPPAEPVADQPQVEQTIAAALEPPPDTSKPFEIDDETDEEIGVVVETQSTQVPSIHVDENIFKIPMPVTAAPTSETVEPEPPAKAVTTKTYTQTPYVLSPLPSRIPTFDEENVAAKEPVENTTLPPQRIRLPAIPATPVSPASPSSHDSPVPSFTEPLKKRSEAVSVASFIGQPVESVLSRLGKPLASIKTTAGQQLIFSGITLQTDPEGSTVAQVNITGKQSKILGSIATGEGLTVGSNVREARIRLGIPQERAGSPGLHFPAHGLSIYPLPGNPDIIGSIKLYNSKAN